MGPNPTTPTIMNKKRSKLWKLTRKELNFLVKNSTTFAEILRKIGISVCGGNRANLYYRIKTEKINDKHINHKVGWSKGKQRPKKKYDYSKIFIVSSSITRNFVKNVLLKDNLVKKECAICYLKPVWQNKKLTLVLDHVNGDKNDHRLKNLRLLCPNCHSQTDTFAWKNAHRKRKTAGSSNQ